MTHAHPHIIMQPAPTNSLGVVGFVLSLLGLLGSCGLLSPIGMAVSFAGMFREPKGLAVAGFILGLIGSFWLIFFGFAIILGIAARVFGAW